MALSVMFQDQVAFVDEQDIVGFSLKDDDGNDLYEELHIWEKHDLVTTIILVGESRLTGDKEEYDFPADFVVDVLGVE